MAITREKQSEYDKLKKLLEGCDEFKDDLLFRCGLANICNDCWKRIHNLNLTSMELYDAIC